MGKLLVIGLGGFVGAIARYGLTGVVHRLSNGSFPLGTLVVNVLGCLVIGALMAVVEHRQALSPNTRLFVMVGLLGSFTTFSTFGYETHALLRSGEAAGALLNLLGNVILGLLAVAGSRAVVGLLLR
jgi:CrcB protein